MVTKNTKTISSFELWGPRAASFEPALFEGHVVRTIAPRPAVQGTGMSAAGYRADCMEVLDPKTAQNTFDVVVDNPGLRTWIPPV